MTIKITIELRYDRILSTNLWIIIIDNQNYYRGKIYHISYVSDMSDMRDMVGRHIESSAMIIRIISPLLLSCDVHPIGYCLGCFLNLDPEMFRNICLKIFGNLAQYWIQILGRMQCHRFSPPASGLVSPSDRNIWTFLKRNRNTDSEIFGNIWKSWFDILGGMHCQIYRFSLPASHLVFPSSDNFHLRCFSKYFFRKYLFLL